MTAADDPRQRARLAELRHRLYRADATAADLDRYTALRKELTEAVPPTPPTAAVGTAGALRALAGAALAVGAAAVGALLLLQPDVRGPGPVAGATAAGSAIATPPAARPPQARARSGADLAAAPDPMTIELTVGGARVLGQRFSGSGDAVVPLVTGSAPLQGGRLVVSLTSPGLAPVIWRAEGGAGRPLQSVTVAPATLTTGPASSLPRTVGYPAAPPQRIAVRAAAGTAWTLTAAFRP